MGLIYHNVIIEAKKQKISIKKLAELIGMTEAGLHRSFKNKSLKVSSLIDISKVLNVSISSLIDEETVSLTESYCKVTEVLSSAILGTIHDTTDFYSFIQDYAKTNQKWKDEFNLYVKSKLDKWDESSSKKLTSGKSKRYKELYNKFNKDSKNDSLLISNDLVKNEITKLDNNLKGIKHYVLDIVERDKNFDSSALEYIYEYYINIKQK